MDQKRKREFKNEIYEQFARIGKSFSSPRRLELIDLLAQGERSVEELADGTDMSVANTSRHLQKLKQERLVRSRKDGTYAYYSLSGPEVYEAWQAMRSLAESRLAEVRETVERYLTDRSKLEAIDSAELEARLNDGEVVVLDVRPAVEYKAGHIPGARSVPIDQLEDHLGKLPKEGLIVAYCRGPYCVFSDKAVKRLRTEGFDALRLTEGLPDWASGGRAVESNQSHSG